MTGAITGLVTSVTTGLRSTATIAWLSYRALFTWLNPLGYVANRFVQPVAIAVLFGLFATTIDGNRLDTLVGASVLALSNALMFGVAMAIANERQFGTLELWLLSPQRLVPGVLARALPHLIDGAIATFVCLLVSLAIFGIGVPPQHFLALLPALLACLLSVLGLALLLAAYAVWTRDALGGPNLAALVLMVFSGALVAPAALPVPTLGVSEILPIAAGAAASKLAVNGGVVDATLLLHELVVGAVYLAVATVAMNLAIRRVRLTGLLTFR